MPHDHTVMVRGQLQVEVEHGLGVRFTADQNDRRVMDDDGGRVSA